MGFCPTWAAKPLEKVGDGDQKPTSREEIKHSGVPVGDGWRCEPRGATTPFYFRTPQLDMTCVVHCPQPGQSEAVPTGQKVLLKGRFGLQHHLLEALLVIEVGLQ